ncbi:NfeD family protein [Chloroflexota bacterium]
MSRKESVNPVKRALKDWGKLLVLLLDEIIIVALFIVVLKVFSIRIPWPVTVVLVLVFGVIVFMLNKAVLPCFRWKPVSGPEGMVGACGRVVEPLSPVGTVMVGGERWSANSIDDDIDIDVEVEVVGLDGLMLEVKRKE